MKINVFKIPSQSIDALKMKLESLEMRVKHGDTVDGWECAFYLSSKPEVDEIPWVKDYEGTVAELSNVKNVIHYAVYLCSKGEQHFALTYGKSHFYVRNLCEQEFGLEMAKRIADENDVKQKATKRFSGKKKKEIKSFVKNTKLDNESGESVDYINAAIIPEKQTEFGEKSKFGSSLIISKEDLGVSGITMVLDSIVNTLTEAIRFDLPKTQIIKDEAQIAKFNAELLKQIKADFSSLETSDSSYDLIGTDFVFSANEKFVFAFGRKESAELSDLSHAELKNFIDTHSISDADIFDIRIKVTNENRKSYSRPLFEMIEYTVPNENVILENGKWKKFNEEYLNQINASIDAIEIEETEDAFKEISITEPNFNSSQDVANVGYQKADTDFSKIQIGASYKVEAWDLQRAETVYAVKFGKPQKLVYVCSQAMATLDIIRNNANLKKLDNPPRKYCLWIGIERSELPKQVSEIPSIILKQHMDMFARKCREIGIEPMLKLSKKIK